MVWRRLQLSATERAGLSKELFVLALLVVRRLGLIRERLVDRLSQLFSASLITLGGEVVVEVLLEISAGLLDVMVGIVDLCFFI